jgi:hypothetical protein
MGVLRTVPKIGTGTTENPIRPDTLSSWWQVVEERETEFTIEIMDGDANE